jgi:hypothetical protein
MMWVRILIVFSDDRFLKVFLEGRRKVWGDDRCKYACRHEKIWRIKGEEGKREGIVVDDTISVYDR